MTVDVSPATGPDSDELEYAQRISSLRRRMREHGITAMALASPENILYLTGLDHLGYFAFTLLVLPEDAEPVLITRAMERPTIRAQVPWCRHVTFNEDEARGEIAAAVIARAAHEGAAVALDEDSMFFPPAIAEVIKTSLPHVRWSAGSDLLTTMRAVKSPAEISCVRQAAAISDIAIGAGISAAHPGASEQDVAAEVYRAMIGAGGQPAGFPPLIRPTTLLDQEHVSWSDRPVEQGRGLFLELSASVRRYHAPQSRTVYVGSAPDGAGEAAGTALAGLNAAGEALQPGARTGAVYTAWQRAVSHGSRTATRPIRHHCGYLVGIGFPPSWVGGGEVVGICPGGDTTIVPGMTFHLMSWISQPVGHVVSDTVLVTPTGTELLTTTPRELTIIT
ncbi:M24 family metallopeptidase [Parasphingorhabdus pacifica]